MWYIALWTIAKWVFRYLPVEQILARAFNVVIDKIDTKADFDKITLSIEHCLESAMIMTRIMEDAVATEDAVTILTSEVSRLRRELIKSWAVGESNKKVEEDIALLD